MCRLSTKKDILTERRAMPRKYGALLLTNESRRSEEGENEALHFKDWKNDIFSTASILESLSYERIEFFVCQR